ncbi:MAG: hypothetical protein IT232_11230 [Flavobacteriales bacterium]|nr:hypothetical protein [Flavobacteriales bacterium]
MRFFLIILVFLFSCSGSNSEPEIPSTKDSTLSTQSKISLEKSQIIEPIVDDEIKTYIKNGISLVEIKAEDFSKTSMELTTKQFKEGTNLLSFSVEEISNYTIAIIENNYSITHFNTTSIKKEFLNGNNVFLAFLTDQNNISVKKNKAHILKNVVIGDMETLFEMNQPHLFFYLPQADTKQPVLDFYLVNTSISPTENKVKVTINSTEFLIDKWAAYKIEGNLNHDNTIRIQLVDKNGKFIEGPFNDSGDRSFTFSIG